MRRDQVRADAGRAPSLASVALPEKLIVSPTFHVNAGVGLEMVAVGGASPAATTIEEVPVALLGSVTRNRTVTSPATEYVNVGVAEVESSKAPSPSRSQAYVSVSPGFGSLDPAPLKLTWRGSGPLVGIAWITAVGD